MGSAKQRDNRVERETGKPSSTVTAGDGRKGSDKSGSRAAGRAGTGSTIDVGETSGTTRGAKGGSPKRRTGIRTID
jgi:hypothetical protein